MAAADVKAEKIQLDETLRKKMEVAVFENAKSPAIIDEAIKKIKKERHEFSEKLAETIKSIPTEQLFAQGSSGVTMLHLSVSAGDEETSAALIKRGSMPQLYRADSNGKAPLEDAINLGQKETALSLINKGGVTGAYLSKEKHGVNVYLKSAIDRGMDEVVGALARKLQRTALMPFSDNSIIQSVLREKGIVLGSTPAAAPVKQGEQLAVGK